MSSKKQKKKQKRKQKLQKCKRSIESRLDKTKLPDSEKPMFSASNIHYDLSDKVRALDVGGVGAIHKMVQSIGLIDDIDKNLHLLKIHLPYHESDHVLNVAYNILAGGTCLEDIELLRNNEVYLDALGTPRIPDPTTAGDFFRRFNSFQIELLMDTINESRIRVWKEQPESFFEEAVIDADGTLMKTNGECKEGMDISYKGLWGYHPLVVSLANTGEPLYIINRSGNRPSHEGAFHWLDKSIDHCQKAGFKKILLRGDTDFSQTKHLDRWDDKNIRFVFGMDTMPNLVKIAQNIPEDEWEAMIRRPKYEVETTPRRKPENVKDRIVLEREFENIRLVSEQVSEFPYSPTKCKKTYRMVVVRKNLSIEKGENVLFDDVRYFYYITNDHSSPAYEIVFESNDRCNQENLIEQLKNGVRALNAPVDNLNSNWAYMVIASLAWTLKAWFALMLPEKGRWKDKHQMEKRTVLRMEFKKFLNVFMRVPAQIITQGRKIIYRFLSWNPWQTVFFRFVDRLNSKLTL